VFAFGVILHEMLTGSRPFERESAAEVTAAVLKEDPPDLNEAMGPQLKRIVRRCLEKNPEQRFQSASDLGFALDVLAASSTSSSGATTVLAPSNDAARVSRQGGWTSAAVALLLCVLGAAIGAVVVWNIRSVTPLSPQPIARFVLPVQPGAIATPDLALSPDGAYLAYSSGRPGAKTLYLRNLASSGTAAPAEIEGGDRPFFSPDSKWLGFFAYGKMKKIPVHGGAPITLADAPANHGADWGEYGSIVFAPIERAGVFEVSANGGVPKVLTTPDAKRRETSHVSPRWLPGGRGFVYVARGETQADRAVVAFSLEDRRQRVLLEGDEIPRYVPTGHLVFLHNGTLMAAPFSLERREVSGVPVPLVQSVRTYGVSNSGLLIYMTPSSSAAAQARLVWVNRRGQTEPIGAPPRNYRNPRLSPDGRRVALTVGSDGDMNIWMYDLARDALSRLTFEGRNGWPVWSRDGLHVIYASNRAGTSWDIYRKSADGTAPEEPLLRKSLLQIPQSLTADGRIPGSAPLRPTPRCSR
jgi:serine/threonine-protein kinase